ncbi:hypothetical protein LGMK_02205 [Leuconostoc sp. C2]|uniref:Uncharacterized protein n=1 Tax=Leuconostoc kimchii (strain IMSNU 11154 / KCTC 2386 / IH25) TaxID=762051 RepID=D5T038_LEUKI|nr:hypothetical protein LKI_00470 [Leuconostoc kimchii IMSNU 11154]AEJ30501.1 hypothetical protein LGMK_02205 [Leuconostoc sp. C2]
MTQVQSKWISRVHSILYVLLNQGVESVHFYKIERV